jgi:hypothetical protein
MEKDEQIHSFFSVFTITDVARKKKLLYNSSHSSNFETAQKSRTPRASGDTPPAKS